MYHLVLTEEDFEAISFSGNRYCWSKALLDHCEEGDNEIPEYIAWEIEEAFGLDTEGGHSYFPLLDHRSDLAEKLFSFMNEIV